MHGAHFTGAALIIADGRPAALRAAVEGSLMTLGVDHIDLWQLHRIDPEVPADEQFAAIRWSLAASVA